MPRMPRLRIPGLPLHVVHRGNSRGQCFFCDGDYERYLQKLGQNAVRFECRVHAYVLMVNHVHLLVSPSEPEAISWFMKSVAQDHAQYINRTRSRTGALWENRYYSSIVDSDRYFLACHRYIELNPVRAGLAAAPASYAWSSFRMNACGIDNPIIREHEIYLGLGRDASARRSTYRALFEQPQREDEINTIRLATRGGRPVGSIERLERLKAEAQACRG
jgi:putative transposase